MVLASHSSLVSKSTIDPRRHQVRSHKGKKVFVKKYSQVSKQFLQNEFDRSEELYRSLFRSKLTGAPKPVFVNQRSKEIGFEYLKGHSLSELFHNSSVSDVVLKKHFFATGRALAAYHRTCSKKLDSLYSKVVRYGDLAINNILIVGIVPYFVDAQPLTGRPFAEKGLAIEDLCQFVRTFRRIPLSRVFTLKRDLNLLESLFLKGYIYESGIKFDYRIYAEGMMDEMSFILANRKNSPSLIRRYFDKRLKTKYARIFVDSFTYTERYQDDFVAKKYDQAYERESIHTFVWESFERDLLKRVLKSLPQKKRYLDFATGTGRVLSETENIFKESYGWDISTEMLNIAKDNASSSKLEKLDIFELRPIKREFNCITTFRFFLNADDSLRYAAAFQLSCILNEKGYLVFNVHANRSSYMWFDSALKRLFIGKPLRLLSCRQVKKFLARAGLEIYKEYSYGFFPLMFYNLIGIRFGKRLDTVFSRLFPKWGSHKIYVAKLR